MSDMRQDDRVTSVTFTLPPDHKWTTVEAALVEAHDREYELRMAFFWECERLKAEVERLTAVFVPENLILRAEVERLTKAGDAMVEDLKACYRAEGYDPADSESIPKWFAAKEGKQSK
jgi:hypothetical protein